MSAELRGKGGSFIFGSPAPQTKEEEFTIGDTGASKNSFTVAQSENRIPHSVFSSPSPSSIPPPITISEPSERTLSADLTRLARFGANILDAHSCLIFIPETVLVSLSPGSRSHQQNPVAQETIVLSGIHSLSTEVLKGVKLRPEVGLIGWVAKNKRPIHVSPFERDSRILGVYASDQQLKSFLGTPILCAANKSTAIAGVIACDSKKAFAFSKLQGKFLEDLAEQVAATVDLYRQITEQRQSPMSWEGFIERGYDLVDAIGARSVEVIRCQLENAHSIEAAVGTTEYLAMVEQIFRLIGQSVPPHFPVYRSPMGEIILIVDNMMGDLTINKIEALVERVVKSGGVKVRFKRNAPASHQTRAFSLETLITETNFAIEAPVESVSVKRKVFGFR